MPCSRSCEDYPAAAPASRASLDASAAADRSSSFMSNTVASFATLPALGTYRAVLFVSDAAIPATLGSLDRDADAALRAGASVHPGDPFPVR
jgi:hypothetical protein